MSVTVAAPGQLLENVIGGRRVGAETGDAVDVLNPANAVPIARMTIPTSIASRPAKGKVTRRPLFSPKCRMIPPRRTSEPASMPEIPPTRRLAGVPGDGGDGPGSLASKDASMCVVRLTRRRLQFNGPDSTPRDSGPQPEPRRVGPTDRPQPMARPRTTHHPPLVTPQPVRRDPID